MERQNLLAKIIRHFTHIRLIVEVNNGAGLFDINKISENFFKDLFNLLFGYKLVNINICDEDNFPAIDLGDEESKVAIQVTSTASSTKIRKTINTFIKKELYKKYDRLVILIIASKKNIVAEFDTKGKFVFTPEKDIIFLDDLSREIQAKEYDHQVKICEFLDKELEKVTPTRKEPTISTEVRTIIDLIEYLGKNKEYTEMKKPSFPDPEQKVYRRFSDHAEFIKDQYVMLAPIYKKVKNEAIRVFGSDAPRTTITRTYLMRKSDELLTESDGDPKRALHQLVAYFEDAISKDGVEYDQSAIQYYLIDELINCNVFPN